MSTVAFITRLYEQQKRQQIEQPKPSLLFGLSNVTVQQKVQQTVQQNGGLTCLKKFLLLVTPALHVGRS